VTTILDRLRAFVGGPHALTTDPSHCEDCKKLHEAHAAIEDLEKLRDEMGAEQYPASIGQRARWASIIGDSK